MTTKGEKDKVKQIQDKCQAVLNALLRDEDNKYCVDCDAKGPRWASWNLGVFLCIRCAGIHRNLGVHISKVKSVNLDSWTPEQVVSLQQMGNSRARAVYEANFPDNFRRPQSDTSLESFIRAKYEHKKYIAREWVPPPLPKVNWEKEIDEEIERQKRKKKTSIEKKTISTVEVPQIPKPKSASPKPSRISQPPAIGESKTNADLLSLQNGEDNFSSFVSASTTVPTPALTNENQKSEVSEADALKNEEESFFNQTAPTEKEQVKLTKDKIMALYGNMPPSNNFNPMYPTQQTSFAPPAPIQNYQAPAGFALPAPMQQNGHNQFQPFYQPAMPNQFQAPQTQYSNINGTQAFPSAQFPAMGQFPTQNSAFVGQSGAGGNPFFSSQPGNVHQQFANLSLGKPAPASGTPLATNIWQ